MASILKHLRSSTADKRPTASGLADGQIALNTASGTPAMFFKDSAGNIVKVGPAHIGTTAPNVSPAGSAGNSDGELWIDESLTTRGLKYYDGTAFINLTPSGTTSTVGLVELATDAETQAGTDNVRVVTPSGLQSKISNSTSTTSSTTIASSTAVKSAFDLANAALPKTGGTLTGELLISPSGSLVFEGSSDDSFETTIAVTNPTADRTITFPNVTGNVVTTGDSGTVTSTMILDDTIVNADINSAAAIAHSKLANITAGSVLLGNASNVPTATALSGDVTINSSGVTAISAGVIVNADVNASAAIAGTKISPDFGSQTITTTGVVSAALGAAATPSLTFTGDLNTGIYSPGADQVAISTGGSGRLFVDASGNVILGTTSILSGASGRVLQIGTTTDTASTLQFAATTTGNSYIQFGDGGNPESYAGYLQYMHTDNALLFGTNKQERLRITSAGLVGIGNSSPAGLLHLSSTFGTTLTTGFRIDGTGTAANNVAPISFYTQSSNWGTQHAANIACGNLSGTDGGGYLRFSTSPDGNTAPSERLRITAAGLVGIGTTSPSATLQVSPSSGSANFQVSRGSKGLQINQDSDTADPNINTIGTSALKFLRDGSEMARFDTSSRFLLGTSSSSASARAVFQGNSFAGSQPGIIYLQRDTSSTGLTAGTAMGYIIFADNAGSNYAVIGCEADASTGTNDYPSRLTFSTTADGASSPTERMRISQGGNIRMFAGANNGGLALALTDNSASGQDGITLAHSATGITGSGTVSFRVIANGNVTNTNNSYGAISDLKLKENIVDANSQWDDIKALQVRNYNLKEGQTHTQIGLVAQEVELVSPGLVIESPDRDAEGNDLGTVTKSVNYSVLYMKAVKALQEAMERIEQLEAKVAALESA